MMFELIVTPFELIVTPHVGIGPIKLGMSREQSRKSMKELPKSFKKGLDAKSLTDAYDESALQVFFDENETVEYLEVSHNSLLQVIYKGKDFFGLSAEDAVRLISEDAEYDPTDTNLGASYIFPTLELAIWRPFIPDPDDDESQSFWTIGVGKRGYFSA